MPASLVWCKPFYIPKNPQQTGLLGDRLVVGRRTLDPETEVRILLPQPSQNPFNISFGIPNPKFGVPLAQLEERLPYTQ